MWNEEEFFKDFAKASDKITASDELTERLKNLPTGRKRPRVYYERMVLAAAAIILCVSLGVFGISHISSNNGGDMTDSKVELASKSESDDGMQNIDISGKLELAREYVDNYSVKITDANGNEISQTTRKLIIGQLKNAIIVSEDTQGEYTSYYCEGKKNIEIRIYSADKTNIKVAVIEK